MQSPINPNYHYHSEDFPSVDVIMKGIVSGNRVVLSRAITLIESKQEAHFEKKAQVLEACAKLNRSSLRIGITGVPGAGKSTFIEAFGMRLINNGFKVAVLAIDPSSTKTGGSILGDKTRMDKLSVNPNAFVRPTASGGYLGGTSAYTKEVMQLCEAAGFDRIIVETVGVGQSETLMHELTDLFLLLVVSGTGDELQGIKRGIMEMAHLIAVNKSDGDNVKKAGQAMVQIKNAIHLFPKQDDEWLTKVHAISAIEETGIEELEKSIESFFNYLTVTNQLFTRRQEQDDFWMEKYIQEQVSLQLFKGLNANEIHQMKENARHKYKSVFDAANAFVLELIRKKQIN